MVINDLESSAHFKLAQILDVLYEQHQVVLDFQQSNFDQLIEAYDQCVAARTRIVESTGHNTYHENKGYLEAGLIQEAIHIFLSEVAPKRLNRRLKSNPSFGANNE